MPLAKDLYKRVLRGDRITVSKAISAIEDQDPGSEELLKKLFSYTGHSFIIGITGPPGTGKSSLVDQLANAYRSKTTTNGNATPAPVATATITPNGNNGEKVAILAVDPSSPVSGGAILGDRVRMIRHALDPGVYIRSMASRGDEGGLSRAARNAIRVLDAAGNDIVIVETVGIGQAEVEVVQVADLVIVVLMPELGDEIQSIKAGLMEIGDIFAVNKSDLPGADKVIYNLESILGSKDDGGWTQKSIKVSAKTGEGIQQLVSSIEEYRARFWRSEAAKKRKLSNLSDELLRNVAFALFERAEYSLKGTKELQEIVSKVGAKQLDPESATKILLNMVLSSSKEKEESLRSRRRAKKNKNS